MLNEHLLDRGITDPAVLRAISNVPRERFVAWESLSEAYADRALPIECGQSISQPYIVGLMTQALALSGVEKVLEIGTGSGYQTAILAQLAREVVTMERHADLLRGAESLLSELGYTNITYVVGDGTRGWPPQAPYDRILVAAAATQCPPALLEQLAEGGILVIPLGPPEDQVLQQIRKQSGRFKTRKLTHCRFVPLVAE
jgi:protein-L-isoaspartate(D-aspartate) O-methyltransferase